jgi:hypothetical protein
MKSRPSILKLALMLVVVCAAPLLAQSNKPSALILPPPDWDAGKHILAQLLATNKPGDYPLPYAWVGVMKVTAWSDGYPILKEERETGEVFEFDKFTVIDPRRALIHADRFIISTGSTGQFRVEAIYRPSLPADAELLKLQDLSSITNFLGYSPLGWALNFTNLVVKPEAEASSFHFFTLGPYDSLEILEVTFLRRFREPTNLPSVQVKRGRLHPRAKKQ